MNSISGINIVACRWTPENRLLRIILLLSVLTAVFCSSMYTQYSQWQSDPEVDKLVQKGIDQIYNYEFDGADTTFNEVIRLRPEHPIGYFFRSMILWERIISKFDDESQDEKLYKSLDVVIDMCDRILDDDPENLAALFFKGGAVGFRGRLRANRGEWLAAANDGMVALPLVRKAYELDPDNYDVLLGMGIYNYYASVIPDKYPIVKPAMIFFPGGDRKEGMVQLEKASLHAKYARVEAAYFLMQNYFTYEKEPAKALVIARKLHAKYPNNSTFHRYLGRCLVGTGSVGEAQDVFVEIFKRYTKNQTGYDIYDVREAHYYIGKFAFLAGRYDSALSNLYKCDEYSRKLDKGEPSGFMSLANLLIGMIFDVQGKRNYAVKQYKKVLDMKEYENSRRDSEKYLEQPYRRN